MNDSLSNYKRKDHFIQAHPYLFTKNQVDWWIRNRRDNGLSQSKALFKVSNQWYFHESNFIKWFETHSA